MEFDDETVVATKMTFKPNTVKITYDCRHCGRPHSHGISPLCVDDFPIHRTSHCPKMKGGVFIHAPTLKA